MNVQLHGFQHNQKKLCKREVYYVKRERNIRFSATRSFGVDNHRLLLMMDGTTEGRRRGRGEGAKLDRMTSTKLATTWFVLSKLSISLMSQKVKKRRKKIHLYKQMVY